MKNKKMVIKLLVVFGLVMILASCGRKTATEESQEGLKVITTFFPVYEFTRQVVGSEGEVSLLVDGNIDPHDFEPSAQDIARIQEADVFVYHGDDMEAWVPSVLEAIDTSQVTVIEASKGLTLLAGAEDDHDHEGEESEHDHDHDHSGLHLHGVKDHYHSGDKVLLEAHGLADLEFEEIQWLIKEADDQFVPIEGETAETLELTITKTLEIGLQVVDSQGQVTGEITPVQLVVDDHEEEDHHGHTHSHEFDPHTWLDPVLAQQKVATITEKLSDAYPQDKEQFEKNQAAYNSELKALDEEFATAFKEAENRLFITQHTAFAYLANRYDLEQRGISGVSTELEPTAKELADMETFVKENHVKVIFTEDQASEKIAKTVADSTGAELAVLSPLENVSQSDREAGETYVSIMRKNLEALKKVIN